jgi:UDP-arabinose 4-epimerase
VVRIALFVDGLSLVPYSCLSFLLRTGPNPSRSLFCPTHQLIMKILVVGGAGYIGSHTARVLRKNGFEVLIYDNLSTGFEFLAKGFDLVIGDVHDRSKLLEVLKQSDAVMYFAANHYVGESMVNPRKYYRNNVEGGLSLLNCVVDAGTKTFIFSSTCSIYGAPAKMPITEEYPRLPVNPYGVSKVFFEQALESYGEAYGLRFASLRYFNAAGADESGEIGECHEPEPHLIPLTLRAAAGFGPELQIYGTDYPTPDGTCIRDYINVVDLAEAHVMALNHLMAGNPSFLVNLGTGEGSSVMQVISTVEAATGKKVPRKIVPRRLGDPPALVADPSKAQKLLRWKAKRNLRDNVESAWKWMQKRGK